MQNFIPDKVRIYQNLLRDFLWREISRVVYYDFVMFSEVNPNHIDGKCRRVGIHHQLVIFYFFIFYGDRFKLEVNCRPSSIMLNRPSELSSTVPSRVTFNRLKVLVFFVSSTSSVSSHGDLVDVCLISFA